MVVQYLIADFVYILSDLQSFIACKNYSWQIPKNHLLLIRDLKHDRGKHTAPKIFCTKST